MADEWPRRFPQSGETKQRVLEAPDALARVKAELSRLNRVADNLVIAADVKDDELSRLRREVDDKHGMMRVAIKDAEAAEARCARLQEKLDESYRYRDMYGETIERQRGEITRLQQALREHGRHDERCASRHLDRSAGYTKLPTRFQDCDCGLDEALAGPDKEDER